MISQKRIQTYSHLTIKDMQKDKTQVKWSFSPCFKISMALLWIWIQEFGTILMSLVSHGLCFVLLWITEVCQLKGECDSQHLSCTHNYCGLFVTGFGWGGNSALSPYHHLSLTTDVHLAGLFTRRPHCVCYSVCVSMLSKQIHLKHATYCGGVTPSPNCSLSSQLDGSCLHLWWEGKK